MKTKPNRPSECVSLLGGGQRLASTRVRDGTMGGALSRRPTRQQPKMLQVSTPDSEPKMARAESKEQDASKSRAEGSKGGQAPDSDGSATSSAAVLSLTKVLDDKEAGDAFLVFARADISEENLEFYFEVFNFQSAWDAKGEDEEGRIALSNDVIERFLKSGAPKQVCIGDRKVAAILESGKYSRDMFDEAQRIARKTLSEDIFVRLASHSNTHPSLLESGRSVQSRILIHVCPSCPLLVRSRAFRRVMPVPRSCVSDPSFVARMAG